MHICIIKYPGTSIDDADHQWARKAERALSDLEGPLVEMGLALSMFEIASTSNAPSAAEWSRDADERRQLEEQVRLELALSPIDVSRFEEVRLLAAERHLELKSRRGQLPRSYIHRIPFMHAKAFLFAQDRLEKLFGNLKVMSRVPPAVCTAIDAFSAPITRAVRNSVAHYEDRTRGLGPKGKPIALQPVNNSMMSAPGGALMLENLMDNRFGSTMADGHYGEIEISSKALREATETVQRIVNCFRWAGPPRIVPV